MIALLQPGELVNPLLGPPPTVWGALASPFGLLAFLPLVPLLRLVARFRRRTALTGFGLVWLLGTLGPISAAVLLAGILAGAAWILGLGTLRRHGRIGPRTMTVLVWVGLHALILPVWWVPAADWYGWEPTNLPILHNIGFAYLLLRLIAWGQRLARDPGQPVRPAETVCWLLYAPCMRLGPVLLHETFLERFDAWEPAARPAWREVGRRLGLFLLGMVSLGVVVNNTPSPLSGGLSVFEAPERFPTEQLLRLTYLIPVQVYLLLWSYNELAAGLAAWVGIRVDNNFDWLPRATSIRDFWRRWHVTVGAWLRDNVYIPLGGNRGRVWLHYAAVFGYIGVWHGPSWSFLAWGLGQALALTGQRQWDRLRERRGWAGRPAGPLWTLICWLLTMHFAIATIVIFTDFDHLGARLFPELLRRVMH